MIQVEYVPSNDYGASVEAFKNRDVGLAWFAQDGTGAMVSDVTRIGAELFTRHAFAFEATSILILVAMIGAVVIARREN